MRRALFSSLIASALLAGAALASDLGSLPTIGSTAPAFGLRPFSPQQRAVGEEASTTVELDSYCGVRAVETKAVALVFVNKESAEADLNVVSAWIRRFERDGLRALVLSEVKNPAELPLLERNKYGFPLLDDRRGVVAQRYGLPNVPFVILLDSQCRIMGYSDKAASVERDRIAESIDVIVHDRLGETTAN